MSRLLPNPAILINALVLKEAKASSEIENIITTDDKLYRALSLKGQDIDTATKEVLRYRKALYTGYHFIKQKGFLSTNGILQIQQELEQNQAGIRRLPGTSLRNDRTNQVIYTPPDDPSVLNELMHNLEKYLNTNEPNCTSSNESGQRGENEKRQFSNRTGDPVVSLKSPWLCPIQPKNLRLVVPRRLKPLPPSANQRYPSSKIFSRTPARDKPDGNTPLKKRLAPATRRIVLEGLQGEQSVVEICRREGLNTNIYYRWIGPPKR